MKIKKKASNTYVSCENEGVVQSVNIKNISMLTAFMRDKIYSDTRKAAITETISNAVDEHKKHNVDRPVTVIVTQDFISIRDYAKGLPEQEVYDVFFTYLNSTKDKTDEYVGGFGIGAKSPSSYANTWYVSSYYNGKLNVYVSSVEGDNGVTRKLFSDIDRPGESGICVKIPITVKQGSDLNEELRLITLLLRDIVLFASSEKDNVIEVYYYPINTLDTFEKLSEEEKETYKISKYFAKLCNYRKSDDSLGVFASKYAINNEFFIDEWKLTDAEKNKKYDSDFTNITNGQGIVFRYRKDNISNNDIIVSVVDKDDRLDKRFYERQDICTTYNSDNYTSKIIVTDGYSYYNVSIRDIGRHGEGEDIFKKISSITYPFFIGNYRYYFRSYTGGNFTNIVIFFDRSELPIMPNRETLRNDNLFFRKVYDRITEFYDYFKSNINNITYTLLSSANARHNLITGYDHTLVSNITYFEHIKSILEFIDKSDPKFSDIISVLSLNLSSANRVYTYLALKNIEDKVWFLKPYNKYLTTDFILGNANLIYLHVANSTTKFISGNKLVPEMAPVEFSITGMKEANSSVLNSIDYFTEYYLIVPEDVNVKNINYMYIEYGIYLLLSEDNLEKSNSINTKSDIIKASINTFWRHACPICVIQCKNEEAEDIIKTLNANAKKNKNYFLLSDIKETMDTVLKQSIHYDSSVGFGFYLDSVVKVDRKNRILINRSKAAKANDVIRATIRKVLPANYKQDYVNQKVEINIKDKAITEDTIIELEGISIKNRKTQIDSIAKTKLKNIVIVPETASSVYNKLNDNEKSSVDRWLDFSALNCEALLGSEYIYVLIANTQNYNKLKSLGALEGKDLNAIDQYILRLKEYSVSHNAPYTYLTMLISGKEYNIIEPDDVDKIFKTDDKGKLILGIIAGCLYKLIVPESDIKEFEYSALQANIGRAINHIKILNGGVISNELHTKVVNKLMRPYKDNFIKLYKFVSNKNNYSRVWKAIKLLVSLHKYSIHKVFTYIESRYRKYEEDNMCCFKFNDDVYKILSSIARAIRIDSSDEVIYTILMQEFNEALGFDRNKNISALDKQSLVEEIKTITGIKCEQP